MVAEMQMMKERMDFMMNALRGRVSSNLDELVHRTDSSFATPITSFPLPPKLRMPQVETYDRSSFGIFQNPYALARRGRRNHVPGFPNYTERSCEGMVQQADAQLYQYLQVTKHAICLAFYRGAQV